MRRIIYLILFIYIASVSKPIWIEHVPKLTDPENIESMMVKLDSISKDPEVIQVVDKILEDLDYWIDQIDGSLNEIQDEQNIYKKEEIEETPVLASPTNHSFSILNIEMGDIKSEVEKQLGKPKRETWNEYGVQWYTYHQSYENFVMVSYNDQNKVSGLYTNQDLVTSTNGVVINQSKETVQSTLKSPLEKIRKQNVYYKLNQNGEYEVYTLDDSYVTVFYDKHEHNTVTALQIIDNDLEEKKKTIYSDGSDLLREGFEYQLFDLTNAARKAHGLPILTWSEEVRSTARAHSLDMAQNGYFSHTNLLGQSPFDRMEDDEVKFTLAGENLAYGQFSSIFAHEGLMNSEGHRKNILQPGFTLLGVGVAFNEQSQPYYTENYYRK